MCSVVSSSPHQRALLGGLWPTRWIDQQKAYNNRTRSKKSPEIWLARTISKVQDVLFEMWLARNEALHKTEDSVCNAKRHEELNEEIATIYNRKPHDRFL